MPRWTLVARVSLLGVVALGFASCGAATRTQSREPVQVFDADQVEDSVRRLSGNFVSSAVDDDYRLKNTQAPLQTVLSFDENGTFKRQDRSRIEEGTYLIGTRGELVIYIEKVNGEPLSDARIERYLITDEKGDAITLKSPSRNLTLRKR